MIFQSGMNFDLNRTAAVLKALGNPQDDFPSIHIAGTNGKGSVAALLTQILSEAGYRVGMYTSPHLQNINERFRIGSELITSNELSQLSKKIDNVLKSSSIKRDPVFRLSISRRDPYTGDGLLTEFEYLTVLSFLWFSLRDVDVAVVEVGLGGRLDATNVLGHVLASVITNIELEHTEWLGRTVDKIAAEKAGIVKINTPIVSGAVGSAQKIIKKISVSRNAPFHSVQNHEIGSNKFDKTFLLGLKGNYQKTNAQNVLKTIRLISGYFPELRKKHIVSGFRHASWPGRFEIFEKKLGKFRKTIVLDGAHNPAACRALVKSLRGERISKVHLLFGALKDKDIHNMACRLSSMVRDGWVVPVPSERSANPREIARIKHWAGRMRAGRSVKKSLSDILKENDRDPILITGSLYLVGAARRELVKGRVN